MTEKNADDSLLDMFVFETTQNLKQIEQVAINSEKQNSFTPDDINEIFRMMHTIKGSAAMMSFDGIAILSHKLEDLFSYLRENPSLDYDRSIISEIMLEGSDLINSAISSISEGSTDGFNSEALIQKIDEVLSSFKNDQTSPKNIALPQEEPVSPVKSDEFIPEKYVLLNLYKVLFVFENDCEMENMRAFSLIIRLKDQAEDITYIPENIESDNETAKIIQQNGLLVFFKSTMKYDEVESFFSEDAFMKDLSITKYENITDFERDRDAASSGKAGNNQGAEAVESDKKAPDAAKSLTPQEANASVQKLPGHQGLITVSVAKLDDLMDMIGELVIAESMVINNPDLTDLDVPNFNKAAHQLHKITNEFQDLIMSVRMVPLTNIFQKMNRIVRDMTKKLGKEVNLDIKGAETEVDKNIIDHLSDPLMHLVRNCVDHGIEMPEERKAFGKRREGTVFLEARNDSGEVLIFVRDDGKGLDKKKLVKKAKQKNLLKKPEEEMTDKEIFSLIFLPGFSTNENVTEFSGRGVGMDVVERNIGELGGRVTVDSVEGKGTQFTIRFPMTLAIIKGMNIRIGESIYTLPITSIKESLKPVSKNIIIDPQKNELVLYRGQCYPIIRLHKLYNIDTDITDFSDGIFIMIENEGNTVCLFADELIGENQVVVKPLPSYIKKVVGIAGCTILGDSQISLILDATELTSYNSLE